MEFLAKNARSEAKDAKSLSRPKIQVCSLKTADKRCTEADFKPTEAEKRCTEADEEATEADVRCTEADEEATEVDKTCTEADDKPTDPPGRSTEVTFRYKDYSKGNQQRIMQLDAVEFTRRFLQHILPSGFYKIRYFGILATAHVHTKREQAISLVGQTILLPMLEGLSAYEVVRLLTGKDPARCPVCKKGLMMRYRGLRQLE